MAPAPAPEPLFRKDEKALCFHHELLYDAKVLDVRPIDEDDKKSGFEYKVHYKGWKNTWDDWVPEDRLRKLTQENRELATSLRNDVLAAQREKLKGTSCIFSRPKRPCPDTNIEARMAPSSAPKKKPHASNRGSEERQTSVAAPPRGQKRMRDHDLEKEETFQARRAVRIPMPDRLKSILVDDWENVTKSLQVVQLPVAVPAGVILDEYVAHLKSTRRMQLHETDILEEVVQGLKEYFNRALGRLLLYRFERGQLLELNEKMQEPTGDFVGKKYTDIYGGEHLLRLFVSMPELIAQTNMDAQSVGRLREELTSMLTWMSKEQNVSRFFKSDYESPTQEYIDKVKNGS
ncbi:MRG-domain-containing protein [Sporormia fimetaria CBS 119925]|uniref:Chromatin modification-related protein EAF3 n=1 Tax=Sporormia fimetaria CBS 119925 TaxID=1340428 RepID=A0A6A6VIQ3_9PLEO|nr:MRG-domain-containing protein [Sporormia fimetaria CBS 119925]